MADLQIWDVKEPYLNIHCLLGEGPFHEETTNRLRFVDIRKHQVHTVDLAAGPESLQTITLDVPVGVTADIEGVDPRDRILVGVKYGLAVLDCKTGKYEYLNRFSEAAGPKANSKPTDFERVRANDGAADPHGRFWLGSMTDFNLGEFQQEGSLFLFESGKAPDLVRPDLVIPNAMGWSPDGRTMYFTHTTEGKVYGFDYDSATGGLSNERVVYQHAGPGGPDGFRVDTDGYIWHAVYGAGRVLKISPKDGSIVGEVRLPTPNITCTQFIGTDLFITTAEETEGTAEQNALSGAVFRVNVGSKGVPLNKFHLKA